MLLASGEDSESQVTNQSRSIDRDCDISQREEKDHDINWLDIVHANGSIMDFSPANGKDSQEE